MVECVVGLGKGGYEGGSLKSSCRLEVAAALATPPPTPHPPPTPPRSSPCLHNRGHPHKPPALPTAQPPTAQPQAPLRSSTYPSSHDDKFGVQKNWFTALYQQLNYFAKTGAVPTLKGRQREVGCAGGPTSRMVGCMLG